jgi:DNA (cytosine-5)-methyltransferase 1
MIKKVFTKNAGQKIKNTKKLTAIDLFCGCGGLTLGLKRAGFKVIGAVDIDSNSIKTYKANHPEVRVWENDIRMLDPMQIKEDLCLENQLDLLAGCPPCQGFSKMRTLNGRLKIKDSRNDLLFEFQRFVEILLPKTIMMENVPGLADDKIFDIFSKKMKELGYIGEKKVLNAADYGVPQRRHRLIYLAGLRNTIEFANPAYARKTVRDAIGKLPKSGKSNDSAHDISENRSKKVMRLIKKIPKDGGSRTDLPRRNQLKCHKECTGFKDVYGRMAWDKVAPTITSGCFNPSKGRFLHPREHRAITLREAALLQGFPRRYKFPTAENKSAVALMIGNALPPPFIRHHAKSIYKFLLANP